MINPPHVNYVGNMLYVQQKVLDRCTFVIPIIMWYQVAWFEPEEILKEKQYMISEIAASKYIVVENNCTGIVSYIS